MERTGKMTRKSPPKAASGRSISNTLGKKIKSKSTRRSTLVDTYAAAAQSNATKRSYAAAVRHFTHHGGAIPANAVMVAEYLAACAGSVAVATLQHRLIAIHRAHLDKEVPSPVMEPLVKRTMQGIRRTYGTAQRRVRALTKDDLLEMLVLIDQQRPTKAARDKALLLIGFAGAFRRSELVGLRCEDMTEYDNGIELLLHRSKTDQEGVGRTVFIPYAKGSRCPVKALRHWLALAGIGEGFLFRAINRHDHVVSDRALTPQSVALIVKEAVRRMKGSEAAKAVAGHSLRAGYCTEAAIVGLQPYQIREQTGHRSDVTLARYIRPVAKRKIPSLL
jgi:integrase